MKVQEGSPQKAVKEAISDKGMYDLFYSCILIKNKITSEIQNMTRNPHIFVLAVPKQYSYI